jgi:hypothetical protein
MMTAYQVVKTLHVIGFIIAIGITLATYFSYNKFWRLYDTDRDKGLAAFKIVASVQRVGLIGLLIVLLAGFTMLFLVHWTYLSFLWFQIKLGLIVLLFVNGFTLGRISALRLNSLIEHENSNTISKTETDHLRIRFRTFQLLQLLIYALIIIMSVFRFS